MKSDFRVGPWLVSPRLNSVARSDRVVRLEPKVMDVLVCLADSSDVVSKEDLIRQVWEGAFVGDDVLTRSISELRKALEDDSKKPAYIETIPKRGYRLIVRVVPAAVAEPQSTTSSRSRSLRWMIATAAAITLAGAGTYVAGRRGASTPVIRSIAVLPLANLSRDPNQEYLSDGIADELITSLTQIHSLKVIPRTSVLAYKGTRKPLPDIGRELGVDAVVEGSVMQSGGRIRVGARLVHCASNTTIWSDEHERDLNDVMALESEIAGAIAQHVHVTITPAEQQRMAAQPVNAEAYQFYLKGRHQLEHRLVEKAGASFHEAIRLQPDYARAYAGLANSYLLSMYADLPPHEAAKKGKEAALRALQLDDSLGEAHASLGWEIIGYERDWPTAKRELQRAIELDPGYDNAHVWLGCVLLWTGETDRGLEELKKARQISPLADVPNFTFGMGLMQARRYDEAVTALREAVDIDPTFPGSHMWLGLTYVAKGMYAEGIAEMEKTIEWRKLRETTPAGPLSRLAFAYARAGRRNDAIAILHRLQEKAKTGYVPAMTFVVIYTGLDDREHAFYWLRKAVEERGWEVALLKVDPRFDSLRSDPRFNEILRQVHLAN